MIDTIPRKNGQRLRLRTGLIITILGFLLFVLGVRPTIFQLDRSPVTGFVQITVFLIGLGLVCVGGYICLNLLWNGQEKSILADIGIRLVGTGYVIVVASGLADIFAIGSHPYPNIPSFGNVQAYGVMLGEFTIALGFLLFIPLISRKARS